MTTEHRVVFDVDDIVAVRLECGRCRASISYPLDQTFRVPDLCPSCRDPLKDDFKNPQMAQHLESVMDALKGLRKSQKPAYTIRFEIQTPVPPAAR